MIMVFCPNWQMLRGMSLLLGRVLIGGILTCLGAFAVILTCSAFWNKA